MGSDAEMFGNIILCTQTRVYPILIQGLRNDLNKYLTPEFGNLLGTGARDQVANRLIRDSTWMGKIRWTEGWIDG